MNKNMPKKSFLIALLIGALAVPLLALAANGLIEGNGSEHESADATESAARDVLSEPIEKVVNDDTSIEDHLAAACGEDGQALVAEELDGSIDPIEQAALDALRPICDEAGMPLAEAPPVVRQVVVVEQTVAPAVSESNETHEDENREKEHEDEEHEEDEEDEEDDH